MRLSGVVLLRDTAGYRLTPLGDAVGAGRVDAAAANPEPGYGVSVVPLQYVSAQTLLKLMDSFATKAGTVRADTTRNLLLIQGTGAERRTAVDTALSFDVDWMRGQSVGIFPISSGSRRRSSRSWKRSWIPAKTASARTSSSSSRVARLNAIMVVSKRPEMLRTAATWIKRLDRADTARTSVHVYRVKYGEARQIARVLTDMFIGGSSSSLLDSADNQIAPGSGTLGDIERAIACRSTATASSADERLCRDAGAPRTGAPAGLGTLGRRTPAHKRREHSTRSTAAATSGSGKASRCCRTCGSRPTPSTTPC